MPLARRFNSFLHLCVALSGLAFAAADGRPLLAGMVGLAVGVCWLVASRRVDRPLALPRAGINVLVLAAIVNAGLRASAGGGGESVVSTLGQFLVFIILIKLLDRRGARDDAQLLALAIFVSIAAMLTSADLLVGLLLVIFIPISVATAMLWQLRTGQILLARAVAESGAADVPTPEVTPVSGRRPRRAFVSVCAGAVLVSCAIATGVFVVIPRVGGEFLGRFGVTRQAMIGFRETVTLGQAGFLSEDPTPVLDLLVTDAKGENVGSTSITQYLRGAARDQYVPADRVWKDSSQDIPERSSQSSRSRPSVHGIAQDIEADTWGSLKWPRPLAEIDSRDRIAPRLTNQKFTMRTDASNLFFLWKPVRILPDRTIALSFSPETGTVRRSATWGPRFSYTVESVVSDEQSPLTGDAVMDAPKLGFQSGPIHDLASRIVGPARSGRQIATSIRDHLQRNFEYTTEMVAPPESQDAIEFFLFDRKKGHCEYFASAMAAMCQSQGLPARVVTGYVAAEFNSLTGQYTVRQSNAHAWVEAFIISDAEANRGRWERFDPSPPAEIERIHHPAMSILAKARAWYEAIEFGWTSSFVAFDNVSSKRRGGGMFSEADATPWIAIKADRFVAWLRTMASDPSRMPWWLQWSPALGLGAVVVWFGASLMWRRLEPRRVRSAVSREYGYVPERPSGVYAKALRVLERAGVPKPDSVPPARHAADIAARAPRASGALRTLAELHYTSRFGGRETSPAHAAAAQSALRELTEALRTERPAR